MKYHCKNKQLITIKLFVLFLGSFAISIQAQVSDEIAAIERSITPGLRIKGDPVKTSTIEEMMKKYNVPNVSIAVFIDGKMRWTKGYGIADTSGTLVNENTLFQAASISKPVAASGIHKLVQKGKVDIDTDVNEYLTSWKVPDSKFTLEKKVTLRGLMTHSAGTTVHGFPGYKQSDTFPSDVEVLNGEGNTDKIYVDTFPGIINRYSGGGYTILERVVEDVTGQQFAEYMHAEVLLPMGMKNSTYSQPLPEQYQSNISVAFNSEGGIYPGKWHNYPEQAAAGLWTTPQDLSLFLMGIQEAYHGKNNKVLNKDMAKIFLTRHELGHGHGPALFGEEGNEMFGHGGKNAGFSCNMTASIDNGYGMVVMSGADNARPVAEGIERAVAEFYGWKWREVEVIETVELSEKQLSLYAGTYLYKPAQIKVKIYPDGGLLKVDSPFSNEAHLHPLGDDTFIDMEEGVRIEFKIDEEGKCIGLVQGGRIELEKIE